jgi:hypothetical protein
LFNAQEASAPYEPKNDEKEYYDEAQAFEDSFEDERVYRFGIGNEEAI